MEKRPVIIVVCPACSRTVRSRDREIKECECGEKISVKVPHQLRRKR